MVELREKTFNPEDVKSEESKISPGLELLTENDDELSSVEFKKELDVLSKFQRDYGLADGGAALSSMAAHSTPEENAARYVEACISNELYLSAENQLESAEPGKTKALKLLDAKKFSSGEASAVQEVDPPQAPELKVAYDNLKDPKALKEAIRAGFSSFFQKATGASYEALKNKDIETLQFIRNIQPAYSPGETSEIARRRAQLEKRLNDYCEKNKFLKTNYEGILLPSPSSFNNEIVFDLSGEAAAISVAEYSAEISAIADAANTLKSDSDSILPRIKEDKPGREKQDNPKTMHETSKGSDEPSFLEFTTQPFRDVCNELKSLFKRK